jgi:pyruvate formate lyase activating enzyme
MHLAGVQRNSLIDYPGKVSCVLFFSGCNFDCPYCHNPDLVRGGLSYHAYPDEKAVYEFQERRKGFMDGVVISGGEPTKNSDLIPFFNTQVPQFISQGVHGAVKGFIG